MSTQHWETCPSPICNDERGYKDMPNWKNEVVWYPGEPICKMKRTSWNKKQEYVERVLAKGQMKEHGIETPLTVSKLMEL